LTPNLPRLVVLSSLFPSPAQPGAGLFIRERMFRVGRTLPLFVVSPRPWFPGQGLVRRVRPGYRPAAPAHELQHGVDVYRPRFLALPALFRHWDGFFMAIGALPLLRRLRGRFDVIDAHFGYPDGYAASLLGRWLGAPVTITLRGTEVGHSADRRRRRRLLAALEGAAHVFAVSESLKRHVIGLGADGTKVQVLGNGVDTERFRPVDRAEARRRLGLPADAPVLVSVGGLVERKGFHRVIDRLPALRRELPGLRYLIVGGASPEGDMSAELRAQLDRLGLPFASKLAPTDADVRAGATSRGVDPAPEGSGDGAVVHFLGHVPPDALNVPLSAADVFVLATRNEGWANVFLEAMACGLPVVTTDVGGNREVVCHPELGIVVPFGDPAALESALREALARDWDREAIVAHARANSWDSRVDTLVAAFRPLAPASLIEGRRPQGHRGTESESLSQ
jgi:glycosyltransferase involved in cell wall biosynthesis